MAQVIGDRHYDGRACVNGAAPRAERWYILRQCPRCLGRMTGPLAGVVAHRLLPDYDRSNLCTACIYVLAHEPKDAARELARWGTLLAWQQRAMRRQQRRR